MRAVAAVGLSALLVLAVAVAGAGAGAGEAAVPASLAVPPCSTAVAPGPSLSNVVTAFASGTEVPFGVAISANSRSAFVADASGAIVVYALRSGEPTVEKVDSFRYNRQDQPAPPPLGEISPLGATLTPNGKYLIAAAGGGAAVFSVAGVEAKGSPRSAWTAGILRSAGQGAIEAAVSPDGHYVFVTLEDSNDLAVFDLGRALHQGFRPSDLVGTVPLGVAPVGIAVAPGGRYLYVTSEATTANENEGTLTTIDMARAERTPADAVLSTVPAGCSPVRVVATRSRVFVTARGSDALLAFDAHALVGHPASALTGDLPVGEAPVGLALVDHDHSLVIADSDRFSAPGAGASLALVTLGGNDTMTLAGYVATGSFPRDMAASDDGRTLLVTDFGSGQVEAVKVRSLP